ncbi:MAG: HAD family hydrolase [Candidatus Woesearchaeota archaeon]
MTDFESRAIQGIVFDVHGTLLRGTGFFMLDDYLTHGNRDKWDRAMNLPHFTGESDAAATLLREYGLSSKLIRPVAAYLHLRAKWMGFYPEVESVLETVAEGGYSLATLSNTCSVFVDRMGELLSSYVPQMHQFVSPFVGASKPAWEAFMAPLEKLRLEAGQCLFVGDNLAQDGGAVNYGFPFMWIKRRGKVPDRIMLGDFEAPVVNSLDNLPIILGRANARLGEGNYSQQEVMDSLIYAANYG